MRYTVETEIDKPIDEVVALYDDPDNLFTWMEGLQGIDHLSGEPGQPGARAKLHFKMGKREIEMVETILTHQLPEEFTCTYEAKGVFNTVRQHFEKVSAGKTRLVTDTEFQFSGFMRFFAWLMPGAFKKQTKKYQVDFKEFAESQ